MTNELALGVEPAASIGGKIPRVRELHTRFLFPFVFQRGSISAAVSALERATVVGHSNPWRAVVAPALYRDELTYQVKELLFPEPRLRRDCAAYLRVSDACLQRFLPRGFVVVLNDRERIERETGKTGAQSIIERPDAVHASVLHGEGIELFLSDQGVGVLSVTLVALDLELNRATEFNYRLALIRREAALFYVPHPRDDSKVWTNIPPVNKRQIAEPPAIDAEASIRIGTPGGFFTLNELRCALLRPLKPLGYIGEDGQLFQPQFSLFTVARFDAGVDLTDYATRCWIGGFLSALAQVEEPWHAGAVPDQLPVPNRLLNRCHWAAASLYAAASVITDQLPPGSAYDDHPFNASRVSRVREKYFVAYLIAEIQRLVLHRALSEAAAVLEVQHDQAAERLGALRRRLLEFTLRGQFDQMSHRHAVHRFYRVMIRGMALSNTWHELRQVMAELDSRNLADRQARTQHAAHVIEKLIASVYGAHLADMFLHQGEFITEYPHLRAAFVILAAIVGWFLASTVTRRMGRSHKPAIPDDGTVR